MNQCVPSWEIEENHHLHLPSNRFTNLRAHSNTSSLPPDVPTLDYQVAELTWENGQIAMHSLGPPRYGKTMAAAPGSVKYTWEKELPPSGGTLESVVNQATGGGAILPNKTNMQQSVVCRDVVCVDDEFSPWFIEAQRNLAAAPPPPPASTAAMVPCKHIRTCTNDRGEPIINHEQNPHCTCVMGCSATLVGSCSAATTGNARVPRISEATGGEQSVSVSGTFGRDSRHVTVDTCEELVSLGFTSTSLGSPGNTSSAKQCTKTGEEYDSACHSRNEKIQKDNAEEKKKGNGKSSVSTKRSRAAAIHNQSERKRRDRINQKMKTLQKLVPNSSKTDKASMLDEVIEYLKSLQSQINFMRSMPMQPMMYPPMSMPQPPPQQQQQMMMPMMPPPMGLGMNMAGMGMMDMNSMGRANMAGMPPLPYPGSYMPPWDGLGVNDRMAVATATSSTMPDPMAAAYMAFQNRPMAMEAFARMAALYQQYQQHQQQQQ